jgi:hypothetical protein
MTTTQNNEETTYTTTYDEQTNSFTRVHKDGCSWTWRARPKPVKPVFAAKNGLTIQKLQEAGNSVRVKHLRWALYLPLYDVYRKSINRNSSARLDAPHSYIASRALVVPSTFRSDPMYIFLPKGGYTHLVIKHKSGRYICVSSECSEDDPFCYAAGIAVALDRLTPSEINLLMS